MKIADEIMRGRGTEGFHWQPVSLFDADSLIMANIRSLATAGLFVTFATGASIAMPPQDIPAEIKSCKAISDDKKRLRQPRMPIRRS